jgi:Trk K+ transport system NAD-binding subunit
VVIASERSQADGVTIEALERSARGAFFVVQINRRNGEAVTRPPGGTRIEAGDGVVVVGRGAGAISTFFATPADRPKAGRTTF